MAGVNVGLGGGRVTVGRLVAGVNVGLGGRVTVGRLMSCDT